jgi:cation diffusion facilitator family transporter
MLDNTIGNKAGIIKTASLIALAGNLALASVKIAAGIISGSLAVIGDGIDSSVDVLIAAMTLAISKIISRPADRDHPWGHGRAETIATSVLACILFFAGAQLILNSTGNFIAGVKHEVPSPSALFVTLFSIGGKLVLAWSQYFLGKKADSLMLRANGKNMAGDVVISAGVLAGLTLSMITGLGIIDAVTAIVVGIWVIKSAVGIFAEANTELMDGGSGAEFYQAVFDAVRSVDEAGNPHRTRMRRIAGLWDIDIDIEVKPGMTVMEAHRIARRVEEAIKQRVEGVYDIMIHVEPKGNVESEGFGLSEEELKKPPKNPLPPEAIHRPET